jgi:hypothetical protein
MQILRALAKVYEEKGSLYTVQNSELYSQTGVDRIQATANLLVLRDLDYAEGSGNAGSKLTLRGLEAVEEYRKNRSVADEFEIKRKDSSGTRRDRFGDRSNMDLDE